MNDSALTFTLQYQYQADYKAINDEKRCGMCDKVYLFGYKCQMALISRSIWAIHRIFPLQCTSGEHMM
jgi:hypothetical protein